MRASSFRRNSDCAQVLYLLGILKFERKFMGSFNLACFVTNQGIPSGQKVRVTPIIQASTFNEVALTDSDGVQHQMYGPSKSVCYSDANWIPITTFFEAEYEDYGRFIFRESDSNRLTAFSLIQYLFKRSLIAAQGSNSIHEPAFDIKQFLMTSTPALYEQLAKEAWHSSVRMYEGVSEEDLSNILNYIQESAWRSRVFVKSNSGAIRPLKFSVMCEAAYQALISHLESLIGWDDLPMDRDSVLTRGVQDAYTRVTQVIDAILTKNPSREIDNHYRAYLFSESLKYLYGQHNASDVYVPPYDFLFSISERAILENPPPVDCFVAELLPTIDDIYAVRALNSLNVTFSPLLSAGQGCDNETGIAYANLVLDVSNRVKKELKYLGKGDPVQYTAVIKLVDLSKIEELEKWFDECDGYFEVETSFNQVASDKVSGMISFSCPFDMETLLEVLKEMPNNPLKDVKSVLNAED